jgi:hypothetical protein
MQMNRLDIFCFILIVFFVAGCDNRKLTPECITEEDLYTAESKQKRVTKKSKDIVKTAKIITIPLTDYSITDTTLNFTGTTLVYWFPPSVMSKHSPVIVKKLGWQYFHTGVDVMGCFEVTREPRLKEKGIRFTRLKHAYSSITVKNGRYKKHLVMESLMYKPGFIVLGKNNNPVFYPLLKYSCENTLLETAYLKLRPE